MYTAFFGLNSNPFRLTPDPEFLFLSKEHKKALTYLNYGISSNTGFILVTGEVGTGKTTLIRKILKGLKDDIKVAHINNALVNSEQLIAMINDDLGIETQGRDKTHMLKDLSDFIIRQYADGLRTTLIIDEAQNLSSELLEEIRLLSNLETEKSKLLQIILVGQPELRNTLAVPALRQLRQRISISCHINPLARGEAENYIFHRLEVAGNRGAVKFSTGAVEAIHKSTRGVPRLINIFCDFLLLAAFTDGMKEITAELVKEVAEDIDSESRFWGDTAQEKKVEASAKALQTVLKRLDHLDEIVRKHDVSSNDIYEIAARVAHMENIIITAVEKLKQCPPCDSFTSDNAAIQDILREIEELKIGNEKLKQQQPFVSATRFH